MSNSFIWPIDKTLSGTGSDGNEWVLYIPQSSSIIGASQSDCLVSYPGHLLLVGILPFLQRSGRCILQPRPSGLRHIQLIDEIWTGITTLGQSGPGSNGNKRVLNTPLQEILIQNLILSTSCSPPKKKRKKIPFYYKTILYK